MGHWPHSMARNELQRAPNPNPVPSMQPRNDRWPNNYATHKAKAIDHLNMAIQELRQGLVNDPRDPKEDKKDKKGKK